MRYDIGELAENPDIRKLLEILSRDTDKETAVAAMNGAVAGAKKCKAIEEANIYVGDYAGGIIDKKTLVERIMDIAFAEKNGEA